MNMAGQHHFNQEFFDNVRVPAGNRVGEENRGWYVGATLLDFERSNIRASIGLRQFVDDLVTFVRERQERAEATAGSLSGARLELADRAVEANLARLISYRIISMQKRGQIPNYEASMNKLFRSEVSQRIAQTGMRLIGLYGNAYRGDKHAVLKGRITSSVSHDGLRHNRRGHERDPAERCRQPRPWSSARLIAHKLAPLWRELRRVATD